MRALFALFAFALLFFSSAALVVSSGRLTNVDVTPKDRTMRVGETQQFIAYGENETHSNLILRNANFELVGDDIGRMTSVASTATVHAEHPGEAILRITEPTSGLKAQARIKVELDPELIDLRISPSSAYVPMGGSQEFNLTAEDTFGNSINLSHAPLNWTFTGDIGSITPSGAKVSFRATKVGNGTLTATLLGKSVTARISVLPGPVQTIVVKPENVVLKPGDTQQFEAICYDDYGNVVGTPVEWSADPAVGTIDQSGLFRAKEANAVGNVNASAQGVVGTVRVEVKSLLSMVLNILLNPFVLIPLVIIGLLALLGGAFILLGAATIRPMLFKGAVFRFPLLPPGASILVEGALESRKKELCYEYLKDSLRSGKKAAILGFNPEDWAYWFQKNLPKQLIQSFTSEKVVPGLTEIGLEISKIIKANAADVIYLPVLSVLVGKEKFENVTEFMKFNIEKLKGSGITSVFIIERESIPTTQLASLELLVDCVIEITEEKGITYARVKRLVGREFDSKWKRI